MTTSSNNLLAQEMKRATDLFRNKIITKSNPRIDRNAFVEYWLPLLLSKVDPEKQAGGGPPIAMWVDQIAGGGYNPVDVMDGDQVIYTVPPMLNRDAVALRSGSGLFDAMTHLNNLRDNGRLKEAAELEAKMFDGATAKVDGAATYIFEMNAIAVKEGYKPLIEVSIASPAIAEGEALADTTEEISDF